MREKDVAFCFLRVSDPPFVALWRNRLCLALSEGRMREKDVVFSVS